MIDGGNPKIKQCVVYLSMVPYNILSQETPSCSHLIDERPVKSLRRCEQ